MTAIAGALGSVIGYLGGEAAEVSIFERLLWPQRFYNQVGPLPFIGMCVVLPMAGPLHGAALKTLDKFRDNGIYSTYYRGHLLGTAFYGASKQKYHDRSGSEPSEASEVRNGFWPEVLRRVRPKERQPRRSTAALEPRRARQVIYHLHLSNAGAKAPDSNTILIEEDSVTWHVILGTVASEITAIALALFIGIYEDLIWLAVYFCIPLLLKICGIMCSVRREPLAETDPNCPAEIVQINTADGDFLLIEGPAPVIRQFFRHYGHPKRSHWREIMSIILVYAFVLYFPAGLLSLLWMEPTIQYLWLGYQVYAILDWVELGGQKDM